MASGRKQKKAAHDELAALTDTSRARGDALQSAKDQIRTAAKVTAIALVVVWLLALGFWSGLTSNIPLYIALALTVAVAVAAFMVWRNLGKSQELGDLLGDGGEMSDEERKEKIDKLRPRVEKGEHAAIMAMAQLQMNEEPKEALATLELADLEKGPKLVAHQIRGMRGMIHLNLGDVKAARELADAIDLAKMPDPKSRANLVGVVAEAWARSGNPIEAAELLDKYDPNDKDFQDVKIQLLRARVYACAHKNDMAGMKRAMKGIEEISPQLIAIFVGQKRVHPLLMQEARRRLEKSGFMPRPKIQAARR
ncbi:MAG: hypothetical protein KC933_09390 [Myxococcales bacterium]|nr:hypothetical protein [Myxococcales bacterium]MCB9650101.1 hypothetical protein [Deltaproteobacteria bacterium]